jgi:hypothetical protein
MDDILKVLTTAEKEFIKHHGIDPSDIYDARGEIVKVYHAKAKERDCRFVIANPCPYGHRLKDRSGHCIVCRPMGIAIRNRESGKGVVYVAVNGKFTKVGMIENNIKSVDEAINKREYRLNDEGGYGGRAGWKTVKTWQIEKNAGKVEREAQNLLDKYKVEKDYIHSGELHSAKELFECSIQTAIDAVKKAMEDNQ